MTTSIRTKLGTHRGSRRVWLEGKHLLNNGFLPGMRFDVEKYESHIVIRLNTEGMFKISKRIRDGKIIPIIDLTFRELITIFDGIQVIESKMENGTITISGCN